MNKANEQIVYWIWLQRAMGCGARIADVLQYFKTPLALWQAQENDYRMSDCFGKLRSFSKRRLPMLLDKSLDDCYDILALCQKQHITVLTSDDPRYPNRLRALRDFPAVLYIRGDADSLNPENAIAVIGAREPTQYAIDAATEISSVLAQQNCSIVSGGAVGIDAISHEAALLNGRKTLLVMGCGHGAGYLPKNADLRKRVSQCGALITEYPPLTEPKPGSFPLRNRLISGLSDALVIVQAGDRSGTLNTAGHAKLQGKPLFVLPGSRESKAFAGSNRLLQEGALVVQQGEDILRRFGVTVQAKASLRKTRGEPFAALRLEESQNAESARKKSVAAKAAKKEERCPSEKTCVDSEEKNLSFVPESVSKNALIVYNILQMRPMTLDDVVRSGSLLVPQVLSALTELELCGAITRDEHAVYSCL